MSASSYKKFIGEDIFISELPILFLWSLEHISSNMGTWSLWVPVTLQTPFTTLGISTAHLCPSSQPHCWPGLQPQAGVPSNTVTCLSCRRYGCVRGPPSKGTPKWKYKTYETCNDGMPPHTVWKIMNCILMFWSPWWYSGEESAWRCSRRRFDPRSPTFLTPGIGFVADLLPQMGGGDGFGPPHLPPLTSCYVAQLLTGHRLIHGPRFGDPCYKRNKLSSLTSRHSQSGGELKHMKWEF